MSTEYRAKTFKSGNSVALRLPKGLGVTEGLEMRVREEQGRYIVEPVEKSKGKIDLSFLDGVSFGLKPILSEDRVFDDPPRDWHRLGIVPPDSDEA